MIAKDFYNKSNLERKFFKGRFFHYPMRLPVTVTKKYSYTIKAGDTIYSLAEKVFGKGNEHLWYIIADCNAPRDIYEWETGESIFLPQEIVTEVSNSAKRASDSTSKGVLV